MTGRHSAAVRDDTPWCIASACSLFPADGATVGHRDQNASRRESTGAVLPPWPGWWSGVRPIRDINWEKRIGHGRRQRFG